MIESWSSGIPDANMPEEILVELAGLVARHPWWQARSRLVIALLGELRIEPPAAVLDAGCGWGTTLEALEQAGYRAAGADVSLRALERLDGPRRRLYQVDLAVPLCREVETFRAVLALDVIEHIDDDARAVRTLARLVAPGGCLIVSVPALPGLFSHFDAIQGHRRRYLPDTLRLAFADSELELERVFWWSAWMVPLARWRAVARAGRVGETATEAYRRYLQLPPWPAPRLFEMAFRREQTRALSGKLTTGTSLFAVARKRDAGTGPASV